jgi:hypothetical protein
MIALLLPSRVVSRISPIKAIKFQWVGMWGSR